MLHRRNNAVTMEDCSDNAATGSNDASGEAKGVEAENDEMSRDSTVVSTAL